MSAPALHPAPRSLAGLRVGVSISESEMSERIGFPAWQVNRATVQVAAALMGQGVGVVFGHDWREDGVMQAVHALAQQLQPVAPAARTDSGRNEDTAAPLLQNLLPWPDEPTLPDAERARLAATLRVEETGLPPDLLNVVADRSVAELPAELRAYLRARALTRLRRELDARVHARVCLGGRTDRFQGRYPGVIEEALFAFARDRPLYLTGLLGGATQQLIDALGGRERPARFGEPAAKSGGSIAVLYGRHQTHTLAYDPLSAADRTVDPEGVWDLFRRGGVERLTHANGLSRDENRSLFGAPAIDTVVQLVLRGLSRIRGRDQGP